MSNTQGLSVLLLQTPSPHTFCLLSSFPPCLSLNHFESPGVGDSLPCKHLAETTLTAAAFSQLLTVLKKTVTRRQRVPSQWDLLCLTGRLCRGSWQNHAVRVLPAITIRLGALTVQEGLWEESSLLVTD